MKKHFQDLFEKWNQDVENYLNESEHSGGPGKQRESDKGPRSELEFWRKE
jgi:hypothetical protein